MLLDELRRLVFYDFAAAVGNAETGQFIPNGNDITVVVRNTRLDTATRSYSLSWLGEMYSQEANGSLLIVSNYLLNPPAFSGGSAGGPTTPPASSGEIT